MSVAYTRVMDMTVVREKIAGIPKVEGILFTVEDAVAAGLTQTDLDNCVERKILDPVYPGVSIMIILMGWLMSFILLRQCVYSGNARAMVRW